jgi:hypothetical protein
MIVDRRDMRDRVSSVLRILMKLPPAQPAPAETAPTPTPTRVAAQPSAQPAV